jgi:hypothetical protein
MRSVCTSVTLKYLFVGTVGIIAAYFALTWFFFGSPHPCGILEARVMPSAIKKHHQSALKHALWMGKLWEASGFNNRYLGDEALKAMAAVEAASSEARSEVRRWVSTLTPAECTWQAITWSPPKVAFEEQPAKIPSGYRALRPDEEVLPLDAPLPTTPGGTEK